VRQKTRISDQRRKWLPQPVPGKKRAAEDEPSSSSSYPPMNTMGLAAGLISTAYRSMISARFSRAVIAPAKERFRREKPRCRSERNPRSEDSRLRVQPPRAGTKRKFAGCSWWCFIFRLMVVRVSGSKQKSSSGEQPLWNGRESFPCRAWPDTTAPGRLPAHPKRLSITRKSARCFNSAYPAISRRGRKSRTDKKLCVSFYDGELLLF
jgi:hypothetical protein